MTDTEKASKCATAEESLDEKLKKVKFVIPQSGASHEWSKSEYVRKLALRVKLSMELLQPE